jgi:signal transduction histidine kinase/CheY-like chemotaxis protein
MASLIDVTTRRRFDLGERTTIGRHPFSGVHLADAMVSLAHAEVVRTDDGYRLVDLGSRHGTWIGQQRIAEVELKTGDEFMVGAVRLRFEGEAENDAASPHEIAGLRAVVELARATAVEHDLDRILDKVLAVAFRLLGADRGAIVLHHPETHLPWRRFGRTRDGHPIEVRLSTSAVSQVLANKAGLLISEADPESPLNRAESLVGQGIRSAMYVPMVYQDEILGVLELDSVASEYVFQPVDLEVFSTIAAQAALAVKNAFLVAKVQTAVADESRRLERLVRDLGCGLLLLDADRRIVFANAWAGERPQLTGGAGPGDLLHKIGTVAIDDLLAEDGLPVDVAIGSPRRIYSLTAAPSREAGELVVVVRDVTDERDRESRTAHEERLSLLGQLAGGVAHDFNNLLVVIQSYAGFVDAAVDQPELKDDLEQIRAAAQRAAELTRQLLAFSRREMVTPKVVDVSKTVAGMGSMLRRILGAQVQVTTRLQPDVPGVWIDPSKLEQALMNLVVNARDAMPEGGELTVSVDVEELEGPRAARAKLPPGRYAVLTVADTGLGMDPEVATRIFEPFFTTKPRGRGTGLGLASVYGIVTQAGGSIEVRTAPGAGTTFIVRLPPARASMEVERVPPLAPLVGGTETVLVAEDEDAVRRLTRRILAGAGYQVLEASSAADALAVGERHDGPIHLLLTDLVMPGISGRDLARQLGALRPEMATVFMSGYFQESIGGARWFVAKPFTQEELLRSVRRALDEQSAPRAR